MNILFSKKDHKYSQGDIIYTSVSKKITNYKNEFNKEHWSTYKALEALIPNFKDVKKGWDVSKQDFILYASTLVDEKELALKVLEILDNWDNETNKSINKGNFYHEIKENDSYKRGYEINPFTKEKFKVNTTKHSGEDKGSLITNLYELEDGYYPELILWNDKVRVAGQADKVFIETINDIRYVDVDDWKGLALNTPIATIFGWKNMEDIIVGDIIFDGNGVATRVQHVSEIHYNPCYKILFDTNDELIADHEHRWVVTKRNNKGDYTNDEITTDEMFNRFQNGEVIRIKCESLKTEDIDLPIDPYVLGLWLADGNRSCGTITCVNNDIWDEIERRGYKTSSNHNIKFGKAESRTIFGIRGKLSELGILGNKHIPEIYLRSSHTQRLDLLRGLMDGDGFYHRTRKRCIMSTTKEWQANAAMMLISSLGFKPTLINSKTSGFGKKNIPTYDVCFSSIENPFLVRNKDYNIKDDKYSKYRYVKNISKIDTVPTKCLAVESEDHTYLAGHSLIKTHNTNKQIKTKGFKGQRMKSPLSHLQDCNYVHYNLQISYYAWMMEQFGYTVRNLSFHHYNQMYKLNYLKDEIEKISIVTR